MYACQALALRARASKYSLIISGTRKNTGWGQGGQGENPPRMSRKGRKSSRLKSRHHLVHENWRARQDVRRSLVPPLTSHCHLHFISLPACSLRTWTRKRGKLCARDVFGEPLPVLYSSPPRSPPRVQAARRIPGGAIATVLLSFSHAIAGSCGGGCFRWRGMRVLSRRMMRKWCVRGNVGAARHMMLPRMKTSLNLFISRNSITLDTVAGFLCASDILGNRQESHISLSLSHTHVQSLSQTLFSSLSLTHTHTDEHTHTEVRRGRNYVRPPPSLAGNTRETRPPDER